MLQPLLSTPPSLGPQTTAPPTPIPIPQLHNQLITCLYANLSRDPPPAEVAPWVVATDKPSATAKNASAIGANDKAEERLKREVMALHARDRRRVKTIKPPDSEALQPDGGLKAMQEYRYELAVKPSDTANVSSTSSAAQPTAALARSNWDLDTRRRYVHPLAAETLEFPSQADVQARIEPICADEGLLAGGAQTALQACAELVEQAAEVYLKTILGELQAHVRADAPLPAADDCIHTARFSRQLRREQAGLAPVPHPDPLRTRQPLADADLRLAVELQDPFLLRDRFLADDLFLDQFPVPDDPAETAPLVNGLPATNGELSGLADDQIDDLAWRGGSKGEQDALMAVLDDCLTTV